MAKDFTILAGSVSQGLWISRDGGENWMQWHGHGLLKPLTKEDVSGMWLPFNLEGQVRGLVVDPRNDNVIYAGDELGVLKSIDRGETWRRLNGPFKGHDIWALAVDPSNSNHVFAGGRPAALYRSQDAGETWAELPADLPQSCDIGQPRVVSVKVDPLDGRQVWAGIEVGGAYRSLDGGATWTRAEGGIRSDDFLHRDVHDLQIVPHTQVRAKAGKAALASGHGTSVVVISKGEVFASSDLGETFHSIVKSDAFGQDYCRLLTFKQDDPCTVYLTKGGVAQRQGEIFRSANGGETWRECPLPEHPTSGVFGIATHPSNPDRIVASSLYGEFFVTEDGGDSWTKLHQKLNEIRALAWVPNA